MSIGLNEKWFVISGIFMQTITILGIGRIGCLVAQLLAQLKKYRICVIDQNINLETKTILDEAQNIYSVELQLKETKQLSLLLEENKSIAVVSCLPYYLNLMVAKAAKMLSIHYFDLTEDTHVTQEIRAISKNASSAFVPQCGLAPGFINILTNDIASTFTSLDTIKMRVGALPLASNNALKYACTWSIEGLINEYSNLCPAIVNGVKAQLQPLEGLESLFINGEIYECFNTSGGIGTLDETYDARVKNLMYKTIRYPGHCEIMRFLMNDLELNGDHETLLKVLKKIPTTTRDVVIIYLTVIGQKNSEFTEESYIHKIYSSKIGAHNYTAIQITTAASTVAVVQKILENPENYRGFIKQEIFTVDDILSGLFGDFYKNAEKQHVL